MDASNNFETTIHVDGKQTQPVFNCKNETTDATAICPKFEKTFAILGKKWTGLILEVLLKNGQQRFVDIANEIPQVSDRLLVERLKELEKEGLVKHYVSRNGMLRGYYELTPKGEGLRKVMDEIQCWGDQWLTEAECK